MLRVLALVVDTPAAAFDGGTPERALFEAPLTADEEKLAAETVRLIEAA